MATIADIPNTSSFNLPSYQREQLTTGIVHLGFGAFHRAHQALFTHKVLEQGDYRWGIAAVNLRRGDKLIQQLNQQNCRYSIYEQDKEQQELIICGAVTKGMHPKLDGCAAIIDQMSDPQVKIISLTITEKGYYWNANRQKLDEQHPDICHDIESPSEPVTAIGYIVAALTRRQSQDLPVTLLSCDNFQGNGQILKHAVLALAKHNSAELANWIENHCRFPSCMVDRIVPAMTPEKQQVIRQLLDGIDDPCAVACESFTQWVIEDDFAAGRPAWETVGVQMVDDVEPFETMKLRMLNATHSFLAYLGFLGDYKNIADTMANRHYRENSYDLMINIQAPTLTTLPDVDLKKYANELLNRFSNPHLKHRTYQIAMDGSQKIPQRMAASLLYHLQHDTRYDTLALALAGWIRYTGGQDEQGISFIVEDPLAAQLSERHRQARDDEMRVRESLKLIMDQIVEKYPQVVKTVTDYYRQLYHLGARRTMEALHEHHL
ncbi:MAG: Mannitol 2-dehydrogenase [Candidatus Celerinatantimonas neptuna]|nr:MAG: Mannitol 2-dehydrogenase [Candidatus Celerinatantimonas neptuna]